MTSVGPESQAYLSPILIDNSVWQRERNPVVREALRASIQQWLASSFLICPPIAAEVGFSARSGEDHSVIRDVLTEYRDCPNHPGTRLVLDIQNALFTSGLLRAVGALDTVVAAYAIVNDATLVHYDSDFEYVARVRPDFQHRWIVPRGSL